MKNKIILALFLFSASAFAWNYFQSKQKPQTSKPKPQTASYGSLWNRVDSLQKKGLSKSALDVVMKIYAKAKTENEPPQLVKAVIHRIKFQNLMEEDAVKKAISDLNKEINEAKFPARPLLHSMLAETYWNFYQQNRWQFMNRSETVNYKSDDINTWDLKKILQETVRHYQLSLADKDSSQKVQVNIFDSIIIKGNTPEARKFRPSLYDFLAHRAVDFFMNEESGLTEPSNAYHIDNVAYLDIPDLFLRLPLKTDDTLSMKYNAILILRDLLNFHLDDIHPGALIDADLKRLKFVNSELTVDKKDSLYLLSLQRIADKYAEYPGCTDALYEIANYYSAKGDQYKSGEAEEFHMMKKKAEQICDVAISRFPYSQGGLNCKYLKSMINEKSFSFQSERVNAPGQPFIAKVNYKNISKLYFRIAKNDKDDSENEGLYGEQLVKTYLNLKPVKEWNITLPDDGDKQSHSAEVKIPEMPLGKYIVIASTSESFTYEKNSVAYSTAWISNISFINRRLENGTFDVYVLNRTSGEPLKNVSATLYFSQYSYTSRKYEQKKGASYITNEEGYIAIPAEDNYRNFDIEFVNGDDRLFLKGNFYQFRYNTNKEKHLQTFFFTDRSIYRPGQTIYFKGILIETDGETSAIKPGQKTAVQFYDVNSQKISEQTLTTNEYGTFNGSFTTPQGVLTGQMRIQNENGSLYFSVEEYKRPKFEVTFEPVKGSFRLNDAIAVTGKAISYSGANLSEAKISYHVVRSARFPGWIYYSKAFMPSTPEAEITSGTTTTDSNGNFKITFNAVPDKSISEESEPVFNYEVTADVTDLNGETHSSSQNVSVSYKALFLDTDLKENIDADLMKSFTIHSKNIADQFEPAQGSVTINHLEQPQRLLRDRLWEKSDRHTLTKEEFEKTFPYDIYENENDMTKWKTAEQIFSGNFDTNKDSVVKLLQLAGWKKGKYVVELKSKDKYGKDVKYVRYFTLFSAKEKECPVNSFAWFNAINDKGEPGEMAKFLIGTHDKNVRVLYEVEWKNEITSKQWLMLNDEQRVIEIPIEEKHRGNLAVHFSFIKQNRFYHFDNQITVPWTNKELTISIETFRDKLQPGAKEEWRLKLSGKNSDKIAAEMVAGMYDASLDAFVPHAWNFDIYNSYFMKRNFQAGSGFGIVNSANYSKDWNIIFPPSYRQYDQLNWFDAGFGYFRRGEPMYMQRSLNADMAPSAAGGNQTQAKGNAPKTKNDEAVLQEEITAIPDRDARKKTESETTGKTPSIQTRSRFDETAFFFPQLTTNENGEAIFSFTMPDALTRWKFMGFAHTKDLKYGKIQKELVTQKDLMIIPNAPRFLREGDNMIFPAKITNLSDTSLSVLSSISLYDAITSQNITAKILKGDSISKLTVGKGQNISLGWNLSIPEGIGAIKYRVTASAGKFSDGEEMVIPVLSNKILVTESVPLWANSNQSKTFTLDKLKNVTTSTTLRNHKLTLEFTSNPAWYAVQALPYMMEYPYECSEQIFSRYYANAIASHVVNSSPKIKAVFDSWKSRSPDAFLSNLEKNQELKQLMLEQTPWVLDAKDESERKRRIALLFDLNKMSNELQSALLKLQKKQLPNGAWTWFEGMPEDRYMTQYIVEGFGHLDHLGIKIVRTDDATWNMVKRAIQYLDARIADDYKKMLDLKADISKRQLSSMQIHYLYARSFFKDVPLASDYKKAFDYYLSQEKKFWLDNNEYLKAMMALSLARHNETATANDILKSLKENSLYNEELGRYWKNNVGGYYWAQAPIETQSLLIEAFHDVTKDKQMVDEMQRWLLKNKQTNDWKTTKATAEACYALLLQGTNFLSESKLADITVGKISVTSLPSVTSSTEAGTGYFKTSWAGSDIKSEMGTVKVTNPNSVPAWGALYWQYFENMDKITPHETPLKLSKKLFLEQNSASGKVIAAVDQNANLKPGDRLKVRIELRVDRDMEYVMMKDLRASGTEPENVLSQYKFQDGLGYYESTHDASTDFFFSYLPKGTYVFEYPLLVSQQGDFANGITTIQCMYAPEFTSHSEGIRIKVGR